MKVAVARIPAHWQVFIVTIVVVFMGSMDSGMMPVILDPIEQSFEGTPLSTLSWILTSYTIALAALVVISGRLGDRKGRRRMFFIGGWLFIASSLLCAIAPNAYFLIAMRLLQGTGHALFAPASIGLILVAWPAERRTHALGAWVGVGGIAATVGPLVGGAIAEYSTWRNAFLLHLLIGAPALVAARRVLPDTERQENASIPDIASIVLLTITLAAAVLVMVKAREWGWSHANTLGFTLVAVIGGVAFARRSRSVDTPVLDASLMRPKSYRISMIVSFILALSVFANLVMQAQFLQKVWHYDTFGAGLGVTPLPIGAAIMSPISARLADRFGHRVLILLGITSSIAGLWLFATRLSPTPHYWSEFVVPAALIGAGTWGCAISMINGAAATTLDHENFSVGLAILQTVRQVGSIMGAALFFGLYGQPAADRIYATFIDLWKLFATMPIAALALATMLPGKAPLPDGAGHTSGASMRTR